MWILNVAFKGNIEAYFSSKYQQYFWLYDINFDFSIFDF